MVRPDLSLNDVVDHFIRILLRHHVYPLTLDAFISRSAVDSTTGPNIIDALDPRFFNALQNVAITAEELAFYRILSKSEEPLHIADMAWYFEKVYNISHPTSTVYTRVQEYLVRGGIEVTETTMVPHPFSGENVIRCSYRLTADARERILPAFSLFSP